MNLESRLQRLERRVTRSTLSPGVSIIAPSGGSWALSFGLSNGKNGGGRTLTTYHDTEDEALARFDELISRHGGADVPVVIVDV